MVSESHMVPKELFVTRPEGKGEVVLVLAGVSFLLCPRR